MNIVGYFLPTKIFIQQAMLIQAKHRGKIFYTYSTKNIKTRPVQVLGIFSTSNPSEFKSYQKRTLKIEDLYVSTHAT